MKKCSICLSHISQGQVEAIAEDSPQTVPATTNGSNGNAADTAGDSATTDPTERPAKVSYQEDSSPQPVVNGLS